MATENIRSTDRAIYVKGLDEFRKELRRIEANGGEDGRELLKDANNRVASYVVQQAQRRAAGIGRMQARAASALKANRAQARATITASTRDVPWFFGAEFGAKPNITRRPRAASGWAGAGPWRGYNQFEMWRKPGGGNAGWFLFPTMRAESKNIIEMYGDELDKIARRIFPD